MLQCISPSCSALEPYYGSTTHRWHEYSTLDFESRLSFHPSTVELRLISTPIDGVQDVTGSHNNSGTHTEVGFALIDIRSGWKHNKSEKKTYCAEVMAYNNQEDFDQSGLLEEGPMVVPEVSMRSNNIFIYNYDGCMRTHVFNNLPLETIRSFPLS